MHAIWAALAGMVVYLDTTAIAQTMICQPLIACPTWGFLVGEPEIGLFFGLTFQLIWLGNLQIGAAKFAEGNLGAFIATALAAEASPDGLQWQILGIALVVGLLAAFLGRELTPIVRRLIYRLVPPYVDSAAEGRGARAAMLFLGSIGIHAAAGFLFTLVFFACGKLALGLPLGVSDDVLKGIEPALLGVGAAVAVLLLVKRKTTVVFLIAAGLILGGRFLWPL